VTHRDPKVHMNRRSACIWDVGMRCQGRAGTGRSVR
jgi:hypothetical protein